MKIIKELCEKIDAEIEDANEYAELALKYRESCPGTAELFFKLSAEEMEHMAALHKEVSRQIEAYRQKKGEPPEAMKAVYEYLHERSVERASRVSILQNMYKK